MVNVSAGTEVPYRVVLVGDQTSRSPLDSAMKMSPDGSVVIASGPGSPVTTGVRLSAAAGVDATVASTIGVRTPAPATSNPDQCAPRHRPQA